MTKWNYVFISFADFFYMGKITVLNLCEMKIQNENIINQFKFVVAHLGKYGFFAIMIGWFI